jgi:hypothetical protein
MPGSKCPSNARHAASGGLVRTPETASGLSTGGDDRVDLILTIDTLDCTCAAAASTIAPCAVVELSAARSIFLFPSWCVNPI